MTSFASSRRPAATEVVLNPDTHASGLTRETVDALRYDGQSDDPLEVAGKLHTMMPHGVRVLDVGCGTGSVTLITNRDRGNDVVAIEPDPERARIARSRGLTVHNGILDDAFMANHERFDVVMASDVLEHTPAPVEFLGGMIRAAKPGGLILLSVPNVAHWSVRLNLLMGRFNYEAVGIMDATHLRWFTEKSLKALLDHNRLTILDMSQTVGFTLPIYVHGPARRIPGTLRNSLIKAGTRTFPLLFGCQHVVKARTPA